MKTKLSEEPKPGPQLEPITLQAPPQTPKKVEADDSPLDPMKIRTGLVREADADYAGEDFFNYNYEDEIFEPIDDNVDFEATLVDNDVVYRMQTNPRTDYNTKNEPEEKIVEREETKETKIEKNGVTETVIVKEKIIEKVIIREEYESLREPSVKEEVKKEVIVEKVIKEGPDYYTDSKALPKKEKPLEEKGKK